MNAKEIVTYAGSVLIALAVLALAWQKTITWVEACAFIGTMLFPSAGHVALQRMTTPKDGAQ